MGVPRNFYWRGPEARRRGRDAGGVEGEGNGEGVSPSPADYGVWGSVVSSLSGVRGGALAEKRFDAFSARKKTHLVTTNLAFNFL